MIRKLMWGVLAIGIILIAAPFVIGLPGKASSGEKMLDAFAPLMEEQAVDTTATYYYDVFVPLGDVVPAMSQENIDKFNQYLGGIGAMGSEAQQLVPALAQMTGMSEEEAGGALAANFPAMMQMMQGLPQMQTDFEGLLGLMGSNVEIFQQVPGGLEHYKPLVETMEAQQANYQDVASLPNMNLFTWFFVIPGVLLAGLALAGLFLGGKDTAEPAAA